MASPDDEAKELNRQAIGIAIVFFAAGTAVIWNMWDAFGGGAFETSKVLESFVMGAVLGLLAWVIAWRLMRRKK